MLFIFHFMHAHNTLVTHGSSNRYWAVTNVDYIHSRTSGRVLLMIFLVWIVAVIVSLAPQFGWKDPEYLQRIEQQKCMVSQDIGYQVGASLFVQSCNRGMISCIQLELMGEKYSIYAHVTHTHTQRTEKKNDDSRHRPHSHTP